MNKTLITCYYLLLAGFIGFKVAHTIYQGSVVISSAEQLNELRQEKQLLEFEVSHQTALLAQQTALTTVQAPEQLTAFEPINQPLSVKIDSTLAQR